MNRSDRSSDDSWDSRVFTVLVGEESPTEKDRGGNTLENDDEVGDSMHRGDATNTSGANDDEKSSPPRVDDSTAC